MPKKSDTWKIQLTTAINFLSSKDTDWECVMHLNSDSMKIMIYDKVDEFLETSIRGSDFIFDCVNLLLYECHKIHLKRGESYLDFSGWIKSSKKTC